MYPRRFLILPVLSLLVFLCTRCGQPIPPTGGPKDSLPPRLVKAEPGDSALNFKGNKIVLQFDEYVELQNPFEKLIFSPLPDKQPIAEGKLRTITIRLKDSLEPQTTYSIDFGDAIKDINEGNIIKGFRYTFSTGSYIDSGALSGRVLLAETGKADSTLVVVLHRDMSDSAAEKLRPRYFTRLNGAGYFSFQFIAAGSYQIYALKDADGSKKYDQRSEMIGFLDKPVETGQSEPIIIYAFSEEGEVQPVRPTTSRRAESEDPRRREDKRLRLISNLDAGKLDILGKLVFSSENRIMRFDSSKFRLTDENFQVIPGYLLELDSTGRKLSTIHTWTEDKKYNIIFQKDFATDSAGNSTLRTDTLSFAAKGAADYGSIRVRVTNLDTTERPVLQFVREGKIESSTPVLNPETRYRLFRPGEYEIRILYDRNGNGQWDPGDFKKRIQPERVVNREQKMTVRANWDNELDINLKELFQAESR